MIRRVLPVAAAAASLALLPATAWATPSQAPVESYRSVSYMAAAEDVVLSNGWHATAWVTSAGRGSGGRLSLDVWIPYDCGVRTCTANSWVTTDLTDEQVQFDRSLRTVTVQKASVELIDPVYDPDPWNGSGDPETPAEGVEDGGDPGLAGGSPGLPAPAPLTLSVNLQFTGSGPVDRDATHTTFCGDGQRSCQSIRISAQRAAGARLVLGDLTGEATRGSLFFGQGIDAAAPKISSPGSW